MGWTRRARVRGERPGSRPAACCWGGPRGTALRVRVPHLLVDGLHVCDQDTHALAGLIAPAIPGRVGMRVLAVLTDAGARALEVTA